MRFPSYPVEKFFDAVTGMASSERPLRDRLVSAHLTFAPVKESDFTNPETLSEYKALMEMLTKVKDPDRGYVPATCAVMTDEEAHDAAEQMVSVLRRLVMDG